MEEIIEVASMRLRDILKEMNITAYRISKITGKGIRKYQAMVNGETKPSFDTLIEILTYFPEINETYILRGVGEKFKEDVDNKGEKKTELIKSIVNSKTQEARKEIEKKSQLSDVNIENIENMKKIIQDKDEIIILLKEIIEMQRINLDKFREYEKATPQNTPE